MLPKTNPEASPCPPNRRSQRYYEPLSPQAATLSVCPLSPDLPPQRNTGTRARSIKDTPCAKGTRRRGTISILWPSHPSIISRSARRSDVSTRLAYICIEHNTMPYRSGSNRLSRIPRRGRFSDQFYSRSGIPFSSLWGYSRSVSNTLAEQGRRSQYAKLRFCREAADPTIQPDFP